MTKRKPRFAKAGFARASGAGRFSVPSLLPALALAAGLSAPGGAALAEPVTMLGAKSGAELPSEGLASFYGGKFHGRRTASGEVFDKKKFSAASNHFPLGTWLAVHRPDNGQCAIVRVNDRMSRRQQHRLLDLSKSAAEYLGMLRAGISRVQVAVLAAEQAVLQTLSGGVADCRTFFAASPAVDLGDIDNLPAPAAGLPEAGLHAHPPASPPTSAPASEAATAALPGVPGGVSGGSPISEESATP